MTQAPLCQCGDVLSYDPTDEVLLCWACIGPDRQCKCGAIHRSREGHYLCIDCIGGGTCSCGVCNGAQKARQQYHADIRQLRRTANGAVKPLSAQVYADVVASGDCVYCGSAASHADHVHPVSRGGVDETGNLAPACSACNHSKGDKLLTEWLPERVAYGVRCSPVVAVEYARLTRTIVRQSLWAERISA